MQMGWREKLFTFDFKILTILVPSNTFGADLSRQDVQADYSNTADKEILDQALWNFRRLQFAQLGALS